MPKDTSISIQYPDPLRCNLKEKILTKGELLQRKTENKMTPIGMV